MSLPTMNFPIDVERDQIGRWSCPELRKEQKRLPTLYEKLHDCYYRALIHHWDSIQNWENPYPAIKEFHDKFSLQEHKTALSILKFQVQAYRKVLFPDEHKMIYSFCKKCNQKRFFYRLPYLKNKYDFERKEFPVKIDKLNTLFKCMKCHYVSWEYELAKVKYQESTGVAKLVQEKEFLRNWFGEIAEIRAITEKIDYYCYYDKKSQSLSLDEFFIKKDNEWICIICSKVFKEKRFAKYHMNRLREGKWLPCYKARQSITGICV